MKNLRDLLNELNRLAPSICKLVMASKLHAYNNLDELDVDFNDPDEMLLHTELTGIMEKLNYILYTLKYLSLPIVNEGVLVKNTQGRYEMKNERPYHCGSRIEFYDPGENSWAISRVEHNGNDYYVYGWRNLPLSGLKVRYRSQHLLK